MADAVWLDVLPSMKGFATQLAKDSTRAAADAGKKAGKAWQEAVESGGSAGAALVADLERSARQSAGVVSKMSGAVSQARAAERTATANVVLAEDKLREAREKYGAESAQAQAAELKLESAREKASGATVRYESALDQLKAAQRENTTITGQLEDAQVKLADETRKQPGIWSRFKGSLDGGADSAEKAKKSLGTLVTGVAVVGAAVGAAGAASGAGLFKLGEVFDDVGDTIRIGTGATGEKLGELVDVAKAVGAEVPVAFDQVGPAVADLNTRLGLTGDTLTTVSKQVLQAGELFGEELDIEKASSAFSVFSIRGDDVSGALDTLFRVSQATGVGMNRLTDSVTKQAPALQNLGFGFEDTVALVGSLDKAGIDADATLGAMGKGLVKLAKAGEEPQAAFRRVTDEITDLVAKGDTAGAINLASGIFGTKAANSFVGAVQSGTLALDDLMGAAGTSSDTILGVAGETADFAETWQLVQNNAQLALEPLGSAVFAGVSDTLKGAIPFIKEFATGLQGVASLLLSGDFTDAASTFGWEEDSPQVEFLLTVRDTLIDIKDRASVALADFGDYLTGTVIPAVQSFGGWLEDNRDWLMAVGVAVGTVMGIWKGYQMVMLAWQTAVKIATGVQAAFNLVMSANPIGLVVIAIAAVTAGLVYFFTQTETGKKAWQTFTTFLGDSWKWISGQATKIWGGIMDFFQSVPGKVGSFFSGLKDRLLSPFVTAKNLALVAWGVVSTWFSQLPGRVGGFLSGVKDRLLSPFVAAKDLALSAWRGVTDWFGDLTKKLRLGNIKDILLAPFKAGFNAIARAWNSTVGKLSWSIPNWVPGIGGNSIGVPNIPYLADGGNILRAGWTVIGEAGPEALWLPQGAQVAPLGSDDGPALGGEKFYISSPADPVAVAMAVSRRQNLRRP